MTGGDEEEGEEMNYRQREQHIRNTLVTEPVLAIGLGGKWYWRGRCWSSDSDNLGCFEKDLDLVL